MPYNITNQQIVAELLNRHELFPAPIKREYGSGHVEACIEIDKDHTCTLTIDEEALAALAGIAFVAR